MFTERDGIELVYETCGAGDPPIVFVHGWACDQSYFDRQIAHFRDTHAIAALDLHGHGESGRPDPAPAHYNIGAFADDVLAVAAAAGFERPVVIGHSLGGVTALECASRPGAVRAAVMVDPAPIVSPWIKDYLVQAAESVATDGDGSWRTSFVGNMFLPTDVVRREEIVRAMPKLPPAVAAAALRSIADYDGAAALGRVEVPLLTIGSAVPSNQVGELRAACPAMVIGQTVGAGHFNQLEVPEQVNLMIERFLALHAG